MKNLKALLLLIHYWFPVALGWSIVIVIHRATGWPILTTGIHLYLLSIFAAYTFDRLLDYDDSSRPLWLTLVLSAGLLAAAVPAIALAVHESLQTLSALAVFSMLTVCYSRVKKFPFVKFLLVSIVWVWAAVALAFDNQHWFAWQFWTMQTSMPLVLLIACGCILCDFKDVLSDAQKGVRSLPIMLGLRKATYLTCTVLGLTAYLSYLDGRPGLFICSLLLIGLAQFPNVLALEAIGPLIVDMALTIPGFLIALHWI